MSLLSFHDLNFTEMNNEEKISSIGRSLLNRRSFMKNSGFSVGALGLAQLLAKDGLLGASDPTSFTGKSPIRPNIDPDNPYSPRDLILIHQQNKYW